MKKVNLRMLPIAIILVVSLAAAVVLTSAGNQKLTPVKLLLDWAPNTNHTGLYVALEKGYYKEQGLDVQILNPANAGSTESVVGAGKADFGISFQEWVTNARLSGVPIVSVAAIIQHNTTAFASLKSSGIKTPKDFEGKKYGGWGFPMEKAIINGLMKSKAGDVKKVEFVNIGVNDLTMMLQKKEIDFSWIFYGWDGINAKLKGIDLNCIMLKDYTKVIPDYYSPVIITSESLIKKNPALIKKFLAATSKGYADAIKSPRNAADILLKHAPELDPKLVRASQDWLSPRYQDDAPRWGQQKLSVWQGFADWMYNNKLIDKKLDAAKAFTNDFLPPGGK